MFKKLLAIMLSVTSVASFMPQIPAKAEENERYPYTLFAGSNEEGALTINSNNVCINGNIATNGTISTNAQNFNVNGSKLENVQEDTKLFFNKIDERYFAAHVDTYFEDYFLEETNINVNIPIEAAGDIGLTGNINITSGIKALNDVILSGNVENTQGSVICAETGDITINTDNVNLIGFVYAPNGCVNITAKNLNINSVIIIADTIIINCPNLNANYNAQLAEFLGNESESAVNNDDTELEVVAYGDYDTENEAFTVYWNTTIPEGTFDILISDDEENYTSIGTVKDDDSYEFTFTESFDKKYIKVVETTKSGKIYEAVPFVVICTENGYDTKVLDSDEDGLPDIYELKIGTDINKIDTDEDGLTDYQEYVYINTDPLIYDSVIEGTSDADIDTDEDGLSNIDEFTRETYPWTPDTDNDGLSDYDEIFVYNTDPLVADSDEDGIDDGSEIKLGLDPNSPATNGIPDGEYVIPQSIEADNSILSSVNTSESPYELSIDIKTNGDAEKELTVDESGYSAVIENDAMLGASIDVEISDTCNPEEIVLKFNIKEAYTDNTLNKFSSLDEFKGIKRLNVFTFDEEQGMLLPVDTEFDIENNQLYAEVNKTGTYCLMDMEIWLDNLDVEMPSKNRAFAPKAAPNMIINSTTEKQVNLVFLLQAHYKINSSETENDYRQKFEFQKNIIRKMSRVALSKLKEANVKIYVITYNSQQANCCVSASNGKKYFTDYKDISDAMDDLEYTMGTDVARRELGYKCAGSYTPMYEYNSNTLVYNLINSHTTVDNHIDEDGDSNYDVYYLQDVIYCYNLYSQVYYSEADFYPGRIKQADDPDLSAEIIKCGGISVPINTATDSNFECIKEHFLYNVQQRIGIVLTDTYDIFLPTKWKKITLKNKLTPNGATNSDADSLTDWEEVDTSKITINSDNSIELPVFRMANILEQLTRFNQNGEYNFLVNDIAQRYYLPILSDPTDTDTDDDGLTDEEEYNLDTMPLNSDTDGDGLSDGKEVDLWFDPTNANPDGDSYNDKEELANDTSPFVKNKTVAESSEAFLKGCALGDFDTADSIETLCGQIAGSFVPFAADARDYFANIFVNLDTKAALFNLGGFLLDFIPGGGSAGDAAKAFPKVGRFIGKYADDAPKVAEAIIQGSKHFPESVDAVKGIAKVLPAGAIDDVCDSIKNGSKLTKKDYDKLLDVCKVAGKNTDEVVEITKFRSFRALKKYLGDPGKDKQWHHIVEQCQAKATRSNFDVSDINKVSNVKATPNDVHKEISRYYSSKHDFTGNLTFRDWLNGKSYDEQYKYGMQVWETEMKKAGYSIN